MFNIRYVAWPISLIFLMTADLKAEDFESDLLNAKQLLDQPNSLTQFNGTAQGLDSSIEEDSLSLLGATVPSYYGAVYAGGYSPKSVILNGNAGYVPNSSANNVAVFNLSIPGTAQLVTTVPSGGGGAPNYLLLNGTTAYVTNSNGGLGVIDISSPFAPILKTSTYTGDSSPTYMVIRGTTGYVSNYPGSLGIFDLSTPGNASLIGTVSAGLPSALMMATSGTTAYVACRDGCLGVIDIATPASATFVGSITTGGNNPTFVITSGTTAYVTNFSSSSLGLINIETPGSATLIGTVGSGGNNPNYIAIGGTTLYVANADGSIGVLDISTPGSATLVGSVSTGGITPYMITLNGTLGYVANSGNAVISVLDISVPGTASLLETLPSGGTGPIWITINGPTGYVANTGSDRIGIFGFVPPPPAPPPVPTTATLPVTIQGPGGRTAAELNLMGQTGNLSSQNRSFINALGALQGNTQTDAIIQAGSQHKVLQYQIEKLDLLLHKELDHELYSSRRGIQAFVLAGYDNMKQASKNGYPGYNVDHYYQMLGTSVDWGCMKWLFALAESESYEKLKPRPYNGKASYYTTWGTAAVSSRHNRWQYGLDALFGYSFIDASRKIDVLSLKAKTSHGMWNLSFDAKVSYLFDKERYSFMPYDNLGYIYGHENDYKEHGAPGANLHIFNETISQIRNQLGVKMVQKISRPVQVFVDGAWVYEHYFGHKNYKQQFIGSSISVDVTQTVPTANYGRLNLGFQGCYRDFNWRAAYTGLYGSGLADSAVSVDFGYKF